MPHRLLIPLISLVAIALVTVSCKRREEHPQTIAKRKSNAAQMMPLKVAIAPATLASALADKYRDPIAVTVVSSMATHGYTWLRVKDDSTEGWVAGPMLAVPDGASVQLAGYVPSHQIDAKIVPRHVQTVLFVTQVSGEQVKLYQTAEHAAVHPLLPAGGVTETDLDIDLPLIKKADHDIAELHVRRDELAGRIIAVRAQVVRIAPSITGRHFVFLRDGSGDKYTAILPAMIERAVEPGEVLLLVGRFAAGRQFMRGGAFPVLLEHARLASDVVHAEELKTDIAVYLAQNPTPIDAPPPPPQATEGDAPPPGEETP